MMHDITKITDNILLQFVEMEASGRHVHLSAADAVTLFGHEPTEKAPLSQPGQYVCRERVTLVGPKGKLERVAVLGPCRGESQAELSLTDSVALGMKVPVRLSGDLEGAPCITVCSDRAQVQGKAICAARHLHMTPEDAALHGLENGSAVDVQTLTERPVVFRRVAVRVSGQFATRMHLDHDEANACGFQKGDLGMILHG